MISSAAGVGMTPEALSAAAADLLARVPAMALATCDGRVPWAADVYFAPLGFDLVFFSSPDSRHGRNLAVNPVCAASLHPEAPSWRDIKGLQLEGVAEPVAGVTPGGEGLLAYFRKFPFAETLLADPAGAVEKVRRDRLYRFRTERLYYLDNSLGFGTRFAVAIRAGGLAGPPERA